MSDDSMVSDMLLSPQEMHSDNNNTFEIWSLANTILYVPHICSRCMKYISKQSKDPSPFRALLARSQMLENYEALGKKKYCVG